MNDISIQKFCEKYKFSIEYVTKSENECFDIEDINERLCKRITNDRIKYDMIKEYGWTCPTFEFIRNVSSFNTGTIVSIGSGNGFIEHLLELKNSKVIASDSYEDYEMLEKDRIFHKKPIKIDAINMAKDTKNIDTLLMCWPREFAIDALKNFKGNKVVYVGESMYGCCASDDFFNELHLNWICIKEIYLPNWRHTYNIANFYIKKKEIDQGLTGKKLKNRKRYLRRYKKYNIDLIEYPRIW